MLLLLRPLALLLVVVAAASSPLAAAAAAAVAHDDKPNANATASRIALYYSGWQLIAQRPDQPTPGDHTNLTRIKALTDRGFTHVMLADGNLLNISGAPNRLQSVPRFLAERGLSSYMDIGWSLHTFFMDQDGGVSAKRQESPFVNYSRYSLNLQRMAGIMRTMSPWLAGVSNDLEFPPFPRQHEDPFSYFADLDERLGNRPSSTPLWPSFTDWPRQNAHPLPSTTPSKSSNWTLEKLMYNMPSKTHQSTYTRSTPSEASVVLRVNSSVSMVAALFRPRSPKLTRVDLWLRLTASALPSLPYISYYLAPLKPDGTPDTDRPVQCAMPRPTPFVNPAATGKWIKCGVHASELPP
eukprot:SAG25_NODE_2680_length_1452_cov_2.371027_2_plen_352_part_01